MTDSIKDELKERAKNCKHRHVFFVGTTSNMQAWCKRCGENVTYDIKNNSRGTESKSSTED